MKLIFNTYKQQIHRTIHNLCSIITQKK